MYQFDGNKVPMRPDTYSLIKIDQWGDRQGGREGRMGGWGGERERGRGGRDLV